MRAGPKGTVTADPLDSSSYSTGRAKRRGGSAAIIWSRRAAKVLERHSS
jgi:hypothetical protein